MELNNLNFLKHLIDVFLPSKITPQLKYFRCGNPSKQCGGDKDKVSFGGDC